MLLLVLDGMNDHVISQGTDNRSPHEQVVNAITKCIDVIRSVPEFQHKSNIKEALKELDGEKKKIYLFETLMEHGFDQILQDLPQNTKLHGVVPKCDLHNDRLELDRESLVFDILIPLLSSLAECYTEIDAEAATNLDSATSNQKGKKPPPPKGLLSLLNYTDIACILEFLICTGIIPHLEAHVLPTIQDRIRHLPKSLVGRLPRASLTWGTEVLQSLPPTESEHSTRNKRQLLLQKINYAMFEMEHILNAVFHVLMLDRFRPMLLPRHITDIYATLFQLERLRSLGTHFGNGETLTYSKSKELLLIESVFGLSTGSGAVPRIWSPGMDLHSMTNAFQSILFSGRHAPHWLKQRVGNLLASIATSNSMGLLAIIDTFVVSVSALPTGQLSSASARLGKVLCAKPCDEKNDSDMNYYRSLLNNISDILAFEDLPEAVMTSTNNRVVSCILTAWAVLEHVSYQTRSQFYMQIGKGLFPSAINETHSPVQSVRKVRSLLMFSPTTGKALTDFCVVLLSPFAYGEKQAKESNSTPLGQLIRFACAEGALVCNHTTDAIRTIHLILDVIVKQNVNVTESGKPYKDLAVAIMHAIAPSFLDRDGFFFEKKMQGENVIILLMKNESYNDTLTSIEKRIGCVVNDIIGSSDGNENGNEVAKVASALFQLLLVIYFESVSRTNASMIPDTIIREIHSFKLISMMMLPVLCEKCSPTVLLMPEKDSNGILQTIILVLKTAVDHISSRDETNLDVSDSFGEYTDSISFIDCDTYPITEPKLEYLQDPNDDDISIDINFSIASIVISLLVAILELGSKTRNENDENLLRAMIPYLTVLGSSIIMPIRKSSPENNIERTILSSSLAQIAEMSTYAMSLIHSRSVRNEHITPQPETFKDPLEYVKAMVKECTLQLASDQVPIRAKAVVELRKLVRGFLEKDSNHGVDAPSPLIIEIGDQSSASQAIDSVLLDEILRLSVLALSDPESYVYLASIQTISAIGDLYPERTLSVLLQGVTSEALELTSSEVLQISHSQRVKIIEALTFVVRRRGLAIESHAPLIFNRILFGSSAIGNTSSFAQDEVIQRMIQKETDEYFNNLEDEDFSDATEQSEERMIRFKTGGPIFDAEEYDSVRSATIALLAELISALRPFEIASYCPVLVGLCNDALMLDHSRLVRRSAALVARELYECVHREHHGQDGIKFILSFLSSGEEMLRTTLLRCISADDLDIHNGNRTVPSVKHKVRLFDTAVVTRCQEAIEIRNELEEILTAGNVLLETRMRQEESASSRFIIRELIKK